MKAAAAREVAQQVAREEIEAAREAAQAEREAAEEAALASDFGNVREPSADPILQPMALAVVHVIDPIQQTPPPSKKVLLFFS